MIHCACWNDASNALTNTGRPEFAMLVSSDGISMVSERPKRAQRIEDDVILFGSVPVIMSLIIAVYLMWRKPHRSHSIIAFDAIYELSSVSWQSST